MSQTSTAIEPIWCIAGPTASGKSALCRSIAQYLPIEVINVDSATIYRGMDIGTAKPDMAERSQLSHHLLDILDPLESYSVAKFCTDVQQLIQEIRQRQHVPLLVGGTMMYINALRVGLDDLPTSDPLIRADIEQEAAIQGWPALHEQLAQVDPVTAQRLAPNDSQRIGRALLVYRMTGKPLSSLFGQGAGLVRPLPGLRVISLEPSDRAVLHRRIEQRFDVMLAQGFLEEVRTLHARGDLHPDLPSIRCVGYRQMWEVIEGREPLALAREKAIAATRQLAKRQLTWLRSMDERIRIDSLDTNVASTIKSLLVAESD